jgi:hypothetical protein
MARKGYRSIRLKISTELYDRFVQHFEDHCTTRRTPSGRLARLDDLFFTALSEYAVGAFDNPELDASFEALRPQVEAWVAGGCNSLNSLSPVNSKCWEAN